MSIVAFFDTSGMNQEQYDIVRKDLEDKGLAAPDGRQFHVAWNAPQGLCVLDIWESKEKLDKFAEVLMPCIAATGATPPEPNLFPAHSIING